MLIAKCQLLPFERGPHKRRQIPAIDVFVGRLSGCVVSAGQHYHLVIQIMSGKLMHGAARELWQECQIVLSVNNERLLAPARELLEV